MREMRRILSLLMAIIMTISLMGNALAAERAGLDNFTRKNSYRAGQFSDVKSADWFAGSVKKAYELGLVKGASASSYNPNGNITIAETLALACRLREIFFGGTGTFEQGSTWYQVYVDYAIANDMITSKQFRSYTATATRAEVAAIMAKALPSRALSAINVITDIPDVDKTADYADAVYLLYNAGILTGSDSYGTFYPSNSILRSEVAAIVTRMADQSERKVFTIEEKYENPTKGLKLGVYDIVRVSSGEMWNLDSLVIEALSDFSVEFSASFYRRGSLDHVFATFSGGKAAVDYRDDFGTRHTEGYLVKNADGTISLTLTKCEMPEVETVTYTFEYVGTVEECAIAYHKMILLMGRSSNCGWARTIDFKPTEDMYMQFNEDGTFVYWIGTYHGGDIIFDRFSGYYSVDAHTIYLNGDVYDLSTYTAGSTTMTLKALGKYTTDFSGEYYNEQYEFFEYFSTD